MTDDELVAAFETATLAEFPHESHVRVGWWYVRHYPMLAALSRFRAALRRFAAAKGAADKYHETITVAFMLLIADREREMPDLPWTDFAARNADLLRRSPSALEAYYSRERLASRWGRRSETRPVRRSKSDPPEGRSFYADPFRGSFTQPPGC